MDFANKLPVTRGTIVAICLKLAAPGVMAAGELDWDTFNNGVFDRSHSVGTDVQLITGPIIYREKDEGNYTEGYRPESSRELSGARRRREVYDLPRVWGASGVFSWTLERLEEAGFETVFQCEGSVCGDVAGWQLYLSDLAAGTKSGQHYVIARTGTEPGWSIWAAVYVNNIDGQPRLILDHVVPPESAWADNQVLSDNAIHFPPGGSEASESALDALRHSVKQVDAPQGSKLLILGNADSQGALFMNLWLSGRRAQSVRDYLLAAEALSEHNSVIKPLSSLMPSGDNESSDGRRKNRRVDVLMAD